MLLDERSLDDVVKGFHINERRTGGQLLEYTTSDTGRSVHVVTQLYRQVLFLNNLLKAMQEQGKVNIFMYMLLAEARQNYDQALCQNGDTVKPLEEYIDVNGLSDDGTIDFTPIFHYGVNIHDRAISLVFYTLDPHHYELLKKTLSDLGKTEEIKQLDHAYAQWIEERGRINRSLSDGGRDVSVRTVQGSTRVTQLNVRVVGTGSESLRDEAKVRTGIREELRQVGSSLVLPKTLGFVDTEDGRAARYDVRLHGITLDNALRSRRYHAVAVDYLPEIAAATAELHYAVSTKYPKQEEFNVRDALRQRFDDVRSCYSQDKVASNIRDFLANLTIFDELQIVKQVLNLDSHPKQYLIVLERKNGTYHITRVGRVDFELERMSFVPFTFEVANIYRYGDYCRGSFDEDFRGLDRYIRRHDELQVRRESQITTSSEYISLEIAYLHSVIMRSLCFYNAWFKPGRRLFMLGRVPEILANIEHAITAIKEKDSSTFEHHQDQYLELLGVLPDLKRAASRARYW